MELPGFTRRTYLKGMRTTTSIAALVLAGCGASGGQHPAPATAAAEDSREGDVGVYRLVALPEGSVQVLAAEDDETEPRSRTLFAAAPDFHAHTEMKPADATASAVTVSSTGEVLVVGSTDGSLANNPNLGDSDAFLMRLDSSTGQPQWTIQLGTELADHAVGVGVDGRGGVFIAGTTVGILDGAASTEQDVFVAKYSEQTGERLWLRQYHRPGVDSVRVMQVSADGDVFLAGSSQREGRPLDEAAWDDIAIYANNVAWDGLPELVRQARVMRVVGASGDVSWDQTYPLAMQSEAVSLTLDRQSRPIVVISYDYGPREDRQRYWWDESDGSILAQLAPRDGKVRRAGSSGWTPKDQPSPGGRRAAKLPGGSYYSVATDEHNNIILGGWRTRPGGTCPSHDGQDPVVYSVTSNLRHKTWQQTTLVEPAGNTMFHSATSALVYGSGDRLYDAGYTGGVVDGPQLDVYVRRMDARSGAIIWTQRFATEQGDSPHIASDERDAVYLVGSESVNDSDGSHAYVRKLAASNGREVWKNEFAARH